MPYGEFHSLGKKALTCVAGWYTAKLPRDRTTVKVGPASPDTHLDDGLLKAVQINVAAKGKPG